MALSDDLAQIAAAAAAFSAPEERLVAVLPAEAAAGARTYLCAYEASEGRRAWLALDASGRPIRARSVVREAVSIAAMCEIAEETAGGGDLDELRSRLVTLRLTENPSGIDEADEAALALQRVLGREEPRLATPTHLDAVGVATRRLEKALGDDGGSPFAAAMQRALPTVEQLAAEVERDYKLALR